LNSFTNIIDHIRDNNLENIGK